MNARLLRAVAMPMLLLLVTSCEQPKEIVVEPELATGHWRASIALPGAEIDSAFELDRKDGRWQATLINGRERVPIGEVNYENRELTLRFPGFNNHIKARLADGRLIGDLTIVRQHGETQVMPFSASPGIDHGEATTTDDEVATDLSGRWSVRFHNPDGSDSASIGEFAQRGSRLFGTFLNPNGDHRFLAGQVRGNEFKLSTFDGAHAFVFSGTIADDRIDMADFWSATNWHQKWSATRNPDVELPDAYARTWLRPGYERLEFEFPNAERRPVSLSDERFRGKVVIVTVAGTWCPNCNDEARFLAPVYQQYRERGLEVVALMFEHFEDEDRSFAQIQSFKQKFDIEYEILLAGISDKTLASDALPALSTVLAWPTTIFIDRSGRVRTIHTGFSGPGTGEHFVQLQDEFMGLIAELLDEPANLIETLTQEQPDI